MLQPAKLLDSEVIRSLRTRSKRILHQQDTRREHSLTTCQAHPGSFACLLQFTDAASKAQTGIRAMRDAWIAWHASLPVISSGTAFCDIVCRIECSIARIVLYVYLLAVALIRPYLQLPSPPQLLRASSSPRPTPSSPPPTLSTRASKTHRSCGTRFKAAAMLVAAAPCCFLQFSATLAHQNSFKISSTTIKRITLFLF
jgi:hypothetical protein